MKPFHDTYRLRQFKILNPNLLKELNLL